MIVVYDMNIPKRFIRDTQKMTRIVQFGSVFRSASKEPSEIGGRIRPSQSRCDK